MLSRHPNLFWGLHASQSVAARYIFPDLKRLEREVYHSPLYSAEVTNASFYTSTHPIWLHGVEPNTEMYTYVFLLIWNCGRKVNLKLCVCVRFSRWCNRTILNNSVEVSHHKWIQTNLIYTKLRFGGKFGSTSSRFLLKHSIIIQW